MDPFAGSGTTLLAAQSLRRSFIGFDISEKYRTLFHDRLAASKSSVCLWDETFVVEKILDKRTGDDGSSEYLIRWRGYSDKNATVRRFASRSIWRIKYVLFF